jgi:hypothetical protein
MTAFNPYRAIGLLDSDDMTVRYDDFPLRRHAARYWLKMNRKWGCKKVADNEAKYNGGHKLHHTTVIHSFRVAQSDNLVKQFVYDIDLAYQRQEARERFAVIV